MDLAIRALRDGRPDGAAAAPLLLLSDVTAVVGGPAPLRHAISELAAAVGAGRSQAAGLLVLALERPAALYAQLCSSAAVSLAVLDGFSDPYGWGSPLGSNSSGGSSSSSGATAAVTPLPGCLAQPADGLQRLRQQLDGALAAAGQRQQAVVIDGLAPLLDRWGASAVARFLHGLQASPAVSCLLCGLHADLHSAAALATLEQLAAGTLSLAPCSELERSVCRAARGAEPQGSLSVRLKRATGRVRAATQLYCVDAEGAVAFTEPPADLLNPQAAAEAALAANGGAPAAGAAAAVGGLAQQVAGGMKLGLSAAEEEARQRVQLPFEHQGQGASYQTGDWRDYLPPEAGGRGAGAARPPSAGGGAAAANASAATASSERADEGGQRLGHILYVRDSGSERDSDEDPDDDLDI